MRTDDERKVVCEGCRIRGRCENLYTCKCSCTYVKAPWIHADNPNITEVYPLDPNLEY